MYRDCQIHFHRNEKNLNRGLPKRISSTGSETGLSVLVHSRPEEYHATVHASKGIKVICAGQNGPCSHKTETKFGIIKFAPFFQTVTLDIFSLTLIYLCMKAHTQISPIKCIHHQSWKIRFSMKNLYCSY